MQIFFTGLFFILSAQLHAWDGYDYERGNFIEIEPGNLVREGETIEFYDYGQGYNQLDIDSIERYGNQVEIEGIDDYGQTRIFEMD